MSQINCNKRVIIDVDVGTDDYLAILIFLYAEKLGQVKIDGIVCSMGNTTTENVCKNVVRLLELTQRTDIPVFKGACKQLIPPEEKIKQFHGIDGFGDLEYNKSPDLSIIDKRPAAVAVYDIVSKNSNEISLICVGPLTNVALTIKLYDDFIDNVKDIWIMGGNYTAVGNITATAEYNFYIDPEAAYIVLDNIIKPVYILTWESCLKSQMKSDWHYDVFGNTNNPAIRLLTKAEKSVYTDDWEDIWMPCDAFLASIYLYPTYIKKESSHNATVELHGSQTRGQIVLDHLKCKKPNVTIIEEIDTEKFKDLILEIVKN